MSWHATKHAWAVCTVDKGTKLVLLALAFRVPQGYTSTYPTSLGLIEQLTGYDPRQVRRSLDELERVGEVVRLSRGKLAQYHLVTMEGPLFAGQYRKADKVSAFPQPSHPENPDALSGNVADPVSEKKRTPGPRAGGVSFSQVLRTEVPTTTHSAAVADRLADVHAFLDWWPAVWRVYHDGAEPDIDLERDGPLLLDVLERRTLARVKAMAIAMLLVTAADEKWIAASDHSLFVLRHKAQWLDRRVSQVPEWWVTCPHLPKCERSCTSAQEAVG